MNTSSTIALLGAVAIVGGVAFFALTRGPTKSRAWGPGGTGGGPVGAKASAPPAAIPRKRSDAGKVIDGAGAVLKLLF